MVYGAAAGDIAGSRFEFNNIKTKEFEIFHSRCFFTDDTVMTLAVAMACREYKIHKSLRLFKEQLIDEMHRLGKMYPYAGYGGNFSVWLSTKSRKAYNSWGNGSAMRASPTAYFTDSLEETLALAKASAEVTHNHPKGIEGAQAAAGCVYMALNGASKDEIRSFINDNYYKLDFTIDEIRPVYTFDVSCQGTVPQAIECFLESTGFEDTIRNAVSIGGDCDTSACIAGSIAEAFYGIDDKTKNKVLSYLDEYLKEKIIKLNE